MARDPKYMDMREFGHMMWPSSYIYDDKSEVEGICFDWLNYDEYLSENGKSYPLSMSVVY